MHINYICVHINVTLYFKFMVVYAPIILTCKSFNFLAILPLIVKD